MAPKRRAKNPAGESAKRRARIRLGSPPPPKTITPKPLRKPKHKQELTPEDE